MVKVKKSKTKTKMKDKEMTRLGFALRALGTLGGGKIGAYMGNPAAGAATGHSFAAAISRWLGSGDYTITANTLARASPNGMIPAMHNNGQSIVVRHREFVSEVLSSTSFSVQQSLPINPGMPVTFPWLSSIAAQYEEYRIKGMVYHYVPTSGNAINSTNPALGSVMLQTTYRANAVAPTSKMEMMNEYWASESVPSETYCHPIECNPRENPFNVHYVRTGAVPSGDSPLLYDYGKTFLAVTGNPATGNVLGELWISYEIELRKPVLTGTNDLSTASLTASTATGIDNNHMFGTSLTAQATTMPAGVTYTNGSAVGAINFLPGTIGTYLVTYWATGGAANITLTSVSGTGSSLSPLPFNGSGSLNLASSTSGASLAVVTITNPTTTTTVNYSVGTFTPTRVGVTITAFNPTVTF